MPGKSYVAVTFLAKLGMDINGYVLSAKETKKINRDLQKSFESQQKRVQGVGVAMAAMGGAALAAFGAASKASREFNKSIADITTLTTEAVTNTESLKDSIRGLAVDVGKGTTDVARGAYEVASAFGETALQSKSLEINAKGAAAGMATTLEAIRLTSAVTKGYGDISEKAQQQVMDLSFLTVKLGQTTFPELAASIGRTVPLMAALGGTQEELFASFATLTGVTGTAAEVSSQYSGILTALIKPTTEMKEAIREAGVAHLGLENATQKDLIAQLGVAGALKAVIGTTDGSMDALGKLIRRKEALTATLALTGGQADVFNWKLKEMHSAAGSAEEAFLKVTQGVNKHGFAMEQAGVKMEIASQLLGEAVTPSIATFKSVLADALIVVSSVIKEFPVASKVIGGTAVVVAGLTTAIGVLLIALPKAKAGFIELGGSALFAKGKVLGLSISLKTIIPLLGSILKALPTIAIAGAAAFATWKVTRLISEVTGLDNALQSAVDTLQMSHGEFEKLQAAKMGFTEKAEQALLLRDRLIGIGNAIDPTVDNFRAAVWAIKENSDAYDKLHPRLKKIVDGMTQVREETKKSTEAITENAEQTEEELSAIQSILDTSNQRIKEMTMETTAFKIEQLNIEHQKNLEALANNSATKEQIALVERAHALEISQIKSEAREAERKEESKRWEEQQALLEKQRAIRVEEWEEKRKQEIDHNAFLQEIRDQQNEAVWQRMQERGMWREAELARLQSWHDEQKAALYNRLNDSQINFEQYQAQLTAINQLEQDKRNQILLEAHEKQKSRMQYELEAFSGNISSMTNIASAYASAIDGFFDALHENRMSRLEEWYEGEKTRIENSTGNNETRTSALASLEEKYQNKKAALEQQAAKREKSFAKTQAIINTAVAVTKAISALPWPFNLPLIAFAAATGAAQIALIGGSYSGPGIGDAGGTGSGSGTGTGSGAGGSSGGGGGSKAERGGAAFAEGTKGFIRPPRNFEVGEPFSNEKVELSGVTDGLRMRVTPLKEKQKSGMNSFLGMLSRKSKNITGISQKKLSEISEILNKKQGGHTFTGTQLAIKAMSAIIQRAKKETDWSAEAIDEWYDNNELSAGLSLSDKKKLFETLTTIGGGDKEELKGGRVAGKIRPGVTVSAMPKLLPEKSIESMPVPAGRREIQGREQASGNITFNINTLDAKSFDAIYQEHIRRMILRDKRAGVI